VDGIKASSLATVAIAILTAVLAGLFYLQTSELTTQTEILQREFAVSHRPWIGISDVNFTDNHIFYYYSNYGSIPNLTGKIKAGASNNEIIREELEEISKPAMMSVVLPTQEITHRMSDDINQLLLDARVGGDDFYLGILLEYEYEGNRNGTYGTILKLNIENKALDVMDSWAK